MFYAYCPHCNQMLECDDDMENTALICPCCKKNIVVQKPSAETSVSTQGKQEASSVSPQDEEDKFFKSVGDSPSLTKALGFIATVHTVIAVLAFIFGIVLALNKNQAAAASMMVALILFGWGFLFQAGGQFVRIIYYGARSAKRIKDLLEEEHGSKGK